MLILLLIFSALGIVVFVMSLTENAVKDFIKDHKGSIIRHHKSKILVTCNPDQWEGEVWKLMLNLLL